MIIKKWVIGLCTGFAFWGILFGEILGGIGIPQPAYSLNIYHAIIAAFIVGFPFILGIHTGIMHERNI